MWGRATLVTVTSSTCMTVTSITAPVIVHFSVAVSSPSATRPPDASRLTLASIEDGRGYAGDVRTWGWGPCRGPHVSSSHPQVVLLDELVLAQLAGTVPFELDLSVHDDVAAVGDLGRLVEVLLGHQHGE